MVDENLEIYIEIQFFLEDVPLDRPAPDQKSQRVQMSPAAMTVTFIKCIQRLEDAPPEGGQGVLDAGAQAEDALQVGLPQQLLPVGNEVWRAAQQSRHVMHKLWHQAGVGVVCLAVMVSHHLGETESQGGSQISHKQ